MSEQTAEKWMCSRCAADRRPRNFGNDRSCAFTADGTFTPDNWNCATLEAVSLRFHEENIRRSDESVQVIAGDDYGGFIVLSRYKNRGCTSAAILIGDFFPPQLLTLRIAEAWLDGSFWSGADDSDAFWVGEPHE